MSSRSGSSAYETSKVGSLEYLDKCRSERELEEEIKRIEEERLQEIISFCEKYNEKCRMETESRRTCDRKELTYDVVHPLEKAGEGNNNFVDPPKKSHFVAEYSSTPNMMYQSASVVVRKVTVAKAKNPAPAANATSDAANEENDESSSDTLVNTIDGSSETLNALVMEKALLQGELDQINQQPLNDDIEDEDLREFQKIEKEIKLSEIVQCLANIQQQIDDRQVYSTVSYEQEGHSLCTAAANKSFPDVPNERRYQMDLNLQKAPLAAAETSDDSGGETTDEDATERYCYDFDLPHHPSFSTKKKSSSLPPNEIHSVKVRKCRDGKLQHQRSMTFYVPSSKDAHDSGGLERHLKTLGHDLPIYADYLQVTCCTCSGYLWKLCSNSSNKWTKRFFHFDRHYRVFFYYKTLSQFKKVKKPNGGVYFDEIRDVYIDRARTKNSCERSVSRLGTLRRSKSSDGRCVFVVETARRQFVLSTFIWEVMRIWVDVIFTGAESYFD